MPVNKVRNRCDQSNEMHKSSLKDCRCMNNYYCQGLLFRMVLITFIKAMYERIFPGNDIRVCALNVLWLVRNLIISLRNSSAKRKGKKTTTLWFCMRLLCVFSFLSVHKDYTCTYGHEILNELRKAVDFRLACHHVAFDFEVIYFVVRQIS